METNRARMIVLSLILLSFKTYGELLNAVKGLSVENVEYELGKAPLSVLEKDEALQEIDSIIAQNKQMQNTWGKYINKNSITGLFCLATSCYGYNESKSMLKYMQRNSLTDSNIQGHVQCAIRTLQNTGGFLTTGEKKEQLYTESLVAQFGSKLLVDGFNLAHNFCDRCVPRIAFFAPLSALFGTIGVSQLYKSLTTQNLKDQYKSALAIKQLIESTAIA